MIMNVKHKYNVTYGGRGTCNNQLSTFSVIDLELCMVIKFHKTYECQLEYVSCRNAPYSIFPESNRVLNHNSVPELSSKKFTLSANSKVGTFGKYVLCRQYVITVDVLCFQGRY